MKGRGVKVSDRPKIRSSHDRWLKSLNWLQSSSRALTTIRPNELTTSKKCAPGAFRNSRCWHVAVAAGPRSRLALVEKLVPTACHRDRVTDRAYIVYTHGARARIS